MQPEPPQPPNEALIVPPKAPSAAPIEQPGEIVQTGGFAAEDASFPPGKRRPQSDIPLSPTPQKDTRATSPAPSPPPVNPTAQSLAAVKKLVAEAAEKWDKVTTYEAVVTRRELSPKGDMNDDVVLYQFRKDPMSVYIRNIGESGKGRELLYSPTKHGDKIYAIVGEGDSRLMRAGTKAPAMSPDSPLVKDKTRYSIREAGYGTPIARVAMWAEKVEAGKIPAEALTFLGPVMRPEFKQPVVGVQLKLRAGDDPLLPTGGTRLWFFDKNADSPANGFPVLIIATETNGREVEYYLFEKLKFGAPLTDSDFSPERLNKKR
jgi:hypothetical protein